MTPELRAAEAHERYLYPGDLVASRAPLVVSTVLGSCVSVCLWDATTAIGGINHYLLADRANGAGAAERYGSTAIPMLVDQVMAAGGRRAAVVAKIFGGAELSGSPLGRSVGQANVAVAILALGELGIPIIARDTGGSRARRLVFSTADGVALVRRL